MRLKYRCMPPVAAYVRGSALCFAVTLPTTTALPCLKSCGLVCGIGGDDGVQGADSGFKTVPILRLLIARDAAGMDTALTHQAMVLARRVLATQGLLPPSLFIAADAAAGKPQPSPP